MIGLTVVEAINSDDEILLGAFGIGGSDEVKPTHSILRTIDTFLGVIPSELDNIYVEKAVSIFNLPRIVKLATQMTNCIKILNRHSAIQNGEVL